MSNFVYTGAKTSQISFPLGGIGSGSIGLAGNGRLIDWEIFNRPNKGSVNGFSHFAIRAENDHEVVAARILNSDLLPPYQGELNGPAFNSYGWGPRREYLTGLPHFVSAAFTGEFPIARLDFEDDSFPGRAALQAFNPFIPTNDKDSSIPAAFFDLEVTNTTAEPLTYTFAGVLGNPLPANHLHTVEETPWGHALHLRSDSVGPHELRYGDMTLATDAGLEDDVQVSWQQFWFKGAWFDNLEVYWHDLNTPGPFKNRTYPPEQAATRNEGLLAVHVPVAPGATRHVRFVITWNFPNCENYWKAGAEGTWRNYYATVWPDSLSSAQYALENWPRLYAQTRRFKDALFASSLPDAALDAVSANISILKSPTVLRLEDGTFYGWEGCHPTAGCCEGSCTHVWNYQQALPFLFPNLERSMRDADYAYNLRPDGGMPFRLQLPIGSAPWEFRPCADGQFGGILKLYRDWKISGDSEWLRNLWSAAKKSLEFAWSPRNIDRWDPDKTGVLWGRQHHTLDMELFGPNSWLTGMYLAALKAGAEIAEHLGETESAAEYRQIFARGKAWADENLFNGEYYYQDIDLGDKSIVDAYADDLVIQGGSAQKAYWTEEHGEIKYQIGAGSSIDQVLGQWHASLYGLGEIFDPEKVKMASAAIFKYNYKPLMRNAYNPDRIYCLNDEGGLVICAWPEGERQPVIPAPYSQETMNGFEYSAATHMIMNGLVEEGMTCVAAVRRRYDGERRNPWNEFECGSNYARSMASYALLNAFSGFQFDMVQRTLSFEPVQAEDGRFRCFWSLDSGWGEFEMGPGMAEVRVLYGDLELNSLRLPFLAGQSVREVRVDERPVKFQQEDGVIRFVDGASIRQDSILAINL
ncbi:MAG: GH116 family glycosyl-hydrolase [Chloroflexota bacterium]|nr:GH116 family glycosyl-hydrolase [Chloroflexota bacterium]